MSTEIWANIPGFEGFYQVSNQGRVKRTKPHANMTPDGILHLSRTRKGYVYVRLWKQGDYQRCFVHQLVAVAFIGPRPSKTHLVMHADDNPSNNAATNLAWGTPKDNSGDMFVKGRSAKGERHNQAKLRDSDIPVIDKMLAQGRSCREVAALYSVAVHTIENVRARRRWCHVQRAC